MSEFSEERLRRVEARADRNCRILRHRRFFSYAKEQVTEAPLYEGWLSILAFFRRARLLVWIFRIGTALLALIEAGTVVLLSLLVLLVLLPLGLALIPGFLLATLIESHRQDRRLADLLTGKRICILFLFPESGAFFRGTVRELASERNTVVLIVSPYLLSGKGVRDGRFYTVLREEEGGIYLVRKHYFFHLRQTLLRNANTVYIL